MLPYIYGRRAGIHIINLEHTLTHLRRAACVTRDIAARGGNILFVGQRPFYLDVLVDAARSCEQYYVHGQWLQGCLVNHVHTLKAASLSQRTPIQPDLMVVLDVNECEDALREAQMVKLPTIGLVDTDCDANRVTYCIPGNDDAVSSVSLVASVLAEAAQDGLKQLRQQGMQRKLGKDGTNK